jgi:hypothetical protein
MTYPFFSHRLRTLPRVRRPARAALCLTALLATGACGPTSDVGEPDVVSRSEAINTDDPHIKQYLDPSIAKFLGMSDSIVSAYKAVATAMSINNKIASLLGLPADATLEQTMVAQLEAVKQKLTNITQLIADNSWHLAEEQADDIFTDAAYANTQALQWSQSHTTPIEPNTELWNELDHRSFVAASTFAQSTWYYWPFQNGLPHSWPPEASGNQIFDWRLALPRFMDSIATRISVLAVTRGDFRTDPSVRSELLGYRTALKTYYDKIQAVSTFCTAVQPPSYTEGDLSGLPYYCMSRVTGQQLPAGTVSHRADTGPLLQQLMDAAGLAPVRAMITDLYELAWNITGDNAANIARVDQVPFVGLGVCVEPDTVPPSVHSSLVIRNCSSMPNSGRSWNVEYRNARANGSDYAARLRYDDTNLCVNVPWGSASVHNVLQVYPCSSDVPASNEVFEHTPVGQLLYGGLCFNVSWGAPVDGATVQLYPCEGGSNEHFTLQ